METKTVIVQHGGESHPLTLTSEDGPLTVGHLFAAAEAELHVPRSGQKFIFKGRSLTDDSQLLDNLGIRERSKLMLLGKAASHVDPKEQTQVDSIEKDYDILAKKAEEMERDLDGYRQGFLPADKADDFLKSMTKRRRALAEESLQKLELLDSLELAPPLKPQRKRLVNLLHKLIDRCDEVKELLAKAEKGEEF